MPAVVSDAGPLIHLAQISKLYLLKKLFKQVIITANVKREAVDEGVRLGHADAQIIGKAVEEGWIIVEDFPKRLASASKRLAEDEKYQGQTLRCSFLQERKKQKFWLMRRLLQTLHGCLGLKHGTLGQCF